MKHKYIGQQETKDCAVACLYNIISSHNGNISINKLNFMLKTDKDGTSVYNVVEVANKLGLEAEAYRCELNDLCSLEYPIMAHIKIDGKYNHFVIIDELVDDEMTVFDPIRGYIKYEPEDFCKEWTNVIITFKKTDKLIKEDDSLFTNLFTYIKNNKKLLFVVLCISLIFSLFSIIHSLYLSYLYKNPNVSFIICVIFIFLCILKLILNFYRSTKILDYLRTFDNNIMYRVYNKLLSLPLIYHHNRPVGDVISRINDISNIREFISSISFTFIIDVIYILMISFILFIINKLVFILLLIMSIIYILVYLIYRKNIQSKSLELKQVSSDTNTYLVESLIGIDTIKNLNIEDKIYDTFKDKYKKFVNNNFLLNKFVVNFEIIENFISDVSCIILIFVGIILYKKDIIPLSYVISFNSLVIYFFISLKNFISLDQILINCKNSYKRLVELNKISTNYTSFDIKIDDVKTIKFQKLTYSYNNVNEIIKKLTFTIKKGDSVFINGKSGVGKSTIFKILTKVLDVDRNMVKINNIDINDIDRSEIIKNICYVSQNEYIFTDTILNNIKLYEEATDEEINKVIKVTKIDQILKDRNINLDYLLEENGHNLSGGERQRIILARSLLKNKKVLVLDETLNELDIDSEKEILKNIKNEYKNTLILISHRNYNSNMFNKIIEI